jgi:hypothetical protein
VVQFETVPLPELGLSKKAETPNAEHRTPNIEFRQGEWSVGRWALKRSSGRRVNPADDRVFRLIPVCGQ